MKQTKRNTQTETFTLMLKMYEGYFEPRFAFNAENVQDATDKANRWAHYQGFSTSDVTVYKSTDDEKTYWMHNEYIH